MTTRRTHARGLHDELPCHTHARHPLIADDWADVTCRICITLVNSAEHYLRSLDEPHWALDHVALLELDIPTRRLTIFRADVIEHSIATWGSDRALELLEQRYRAAPPRTRRGHPERVPSGTLFTLLRWALLTDDEHEHTVVAILEAEAAAASLCERLAWCNTHGHEYHLDDGCRDCP